MFRTLCIPGIFRTLAYSYHKAFSVTLPFQTRGIFRTLSNIYNGPFNPGIFRPCHIQNLRNIWNSVKHLWYSIFLEPCVTLAYLEPWYIQNLRKIENLLKHLQCNFFLMNPGIYKIKYLEPFVIITYLDF